MKVLLIPIGSSGDVHPFVGLGRVLRERGHQVVVITNSYFESLIRRVGLDFIPLGEDNYLEAIKDPNLWHPRKGPMQMMRWIGLLIRPLYEILVREYVPGTTVVAAGSLALGARVAQDKLHLPMATVHIQPGVLRSVHRAPIIPGIFMPHWTPRWWKRFLYWFADVVLIDRLIAPEINALRRELGLAPVRRVLHDWWHSPQCILGLFPAWYGEPQPDWPAQTHLTGFPLYDERDVETISPEVQAFLEQGDPPIVFTPGSAMMHAQQFFQESAEACRLLGRRGLLLTRHQEQVPNSLPPGVRHFDYIPFSQVLPRAAALVHHGGIGSTAQPLAAGIPQLLMPMGFDQPDNAARVQRLGVGAAIKPGAYRAGKVASVLKSLLESPQVADRCRQVRARFVNVQPLEEACVVIEQLADKKG